MKRVDVPLPDLVMEALDRRRGETPRSRFVADLVEAALADRAPTPPPQRYAGPPVPNATADCPHPEASLQHYPWGTICGLCGART